MNREATAFQRELEVERILKAFKLKYVSLFIVVRTRIKHPSPYAPRCSTRSPYEILDISEQASAEEIKKKYRQLSLCEHPTDASPALGLGT